MPLCGGFQLSPKGFSEATKKIIFNFSFVFPFFLPSRKNKRREVQIKSASVFITSHQTFITFDFPTDEIPPRPPRIIVSISLCIHIEKNNFPLHLPPSSPFPKWPSSTFVLWVNIREIAARIKMTWSSLGILSSFLRSTCFSPSAFPLNFPAHNPSFPGCLFFRALLDELSWLRCPHFSFKTFRCFY